MALARSLVVKTYEIKAHNGKVMSLDLGETGRVLVTGGQDRNVNLWAIGQDECFMSLTGHNRSIECVRFAYNDDFVYSADDIGIIRRWDLNAQTMYSTLNGHMKSVRTLDFNPSSEYIISGSNDTTVRVWDVLNRNKCVKIFRGHVSYINSVKFSPDGLWIASAGSEGSVIIWDVRKSQQIMHFTEETSMTAVTCIQFHPFEFLLAVGREDGTVFIYDLEKQKCISRTGKTSHFYGHIIKCITFSDNGECLFVGTTEGISVIGWEPDREYDNIKSIWASLGDMKVINNKLICGCYDNDIVSINGVTIDRIIPFYNSSNSQLSFDHNSANRRSFTRGNPKFRLNLSADTKPFQILERSEDIKYPSLSEKLSPQQISLEPIDDLRISSDLAIDEPPALSADIHTYRLVDDVKEAKLGHKYNFINAMHNEKLGLSEVNATNLCNLNYNGLSSLRMLEDCNEFGMERNSDTSYTQDMEFNWSDSNPPVIMNYDNIEMAKDFPVTQNVPQVDSFAIKTAKLNKKTTNISIHKRNIYENPAGKQNSGNKLSTVSSVSSMELNALDDSMLIKKSDPSNLMNNKTKRMATSQTQLNKENSRFKNINVQIITKPPTRSRTTLDMRSTQRAAAKQNEQPMRYRPDLIPHNSERKSITEIQYDVNVLSASHELVLQELCNRHANLQLLQNITRSHDVVGALKTARKMNDRSVFVDLLGSILEKPSAWNLDLCLFVLPEIYELLQSHKKFHFTRACDTLRVILSNFLPIIQENIDPWVANALGVDVTREDRQRKCVECQRWLIQIRSLTEVTKFGNALTQLQNMIII